MTLSLFEGHAGRAPQSRGQERRALQSGLVSLDANVLLSFYRFSPSARHALLEVLRALGDRVFVSHQAVREFWRNRLKAIDARGQARSQIEESLDRSAAQVANAIRAWAKVASVPPSDRDLLLEKMEESFTAIIDLVAAHTPDSSLFTYGVESDETVRQLGALLDGRVGEPLSAGEHAAALLEGDRRVTERIPPGYRDNGKDGEDGAAGDYLVWVQSMKEAKRRGLPLVLVTGDEKEDWWWKHRNVFLGPRPELVTECEEVVGGPLVLMRPLQLIEHAEALSVAVTDEAAADVASAVSVPAPGWTAAGVGAVLDRLDAGGHVQADVIRRAAALGGVIERDEVYEICGYDADRSLRGFTRPITRVTGALQLDGILDEGTEPLLTPQYDTGVVALRFVLPEGVAEFIKENAEGA